MRLASLTTILGAPLALAARLGVRQEDTCARNDCYRAVWGSSPSSVPLLNVLHCQRFLTTTEIRYPLVTSTFASVITTTLTTPCPTGPTSTPILRKSAAFNAANNARKLQGRQETSVQLPPFATSYLTTTTFGPVPTYVTEICGTADYRSACLCKSSFGITSALINTISTTTTSFTTATFTNTIISGTPCPSTSAGTRSSTASGTTSTSTDTASSSSLSVSSESSVVSSSSTTSSIDTTLTASSTGSSSFSSTSSSSTSGSTSTESSTTDSETSFSSSTLSSSSASMTDSTSLFSTTSTRSSTTGSETISSGTLSLSSASMTDTSSWSISTDSSFTRSSTHSSAHFTNTSTIPLSSSSLSTFISTTTTATHDTTFSPSASTSGYGVPPPICNAPGVGLCNGACHDLRTSNDHCGACGNACASNKACWNGVCTSEACDSNCKFARLCNNNGTSSCMCARESGGRGVCYDGSKFKCNETNPEKPRPARCVDTAGCKIGYVCVKEPCSCNGTVAGICVNTTGCGTQGADILGPLVSFGSMGRSKKLF